MTLAQTYARALHEVVTKDTSHSAAYLKNLRSALERRKHEKLLPQIFSEYQHLALKEERTKVHGQVTPESERTRVLLELYRKLIQSNHE